MDKVTSPRVQREGHGGPIFGDCGGVCVWPTPDSAPAMCRGFTVLPDTCRPRADGDRFCGKTVIRENLPSHPSGAVWLLFGAGHLRGASWAVS